MKRLLDQPLFIYLLAVAAIFLFAIAVRCADAQEDAFPAEAQEIVKDWGIYTMGEGGMVVSVREPLTNEKTGFGETFANTAFDTVTRNATEEAKKLLRKLWDTPGISNIRYSTYSIVLFKARMYEWEEVEPVVAAIFEEWHSTTTK